MELQTLQIINQKEITMCDAWMRWSDFWNDQFKQLDSENLNQKN